MTDETTDDFDFARLRFEITRALDGETILPEQLTPGLTARFAAPDEIAILSSEGQELCKVPHYRLRRPDPDQLQKAAEIALTRLPEHVADQCAAAIDAGSFTVSEPVDGDYVYCHVHLTDGQDVALFAAHRAAVVVGYPDDEGESAP